MATDDIRTQIKEKVESMSASHSPKQLRMLEEALVKTRIEGLPLHEVVGVSKESLNYLYTNAYNLYNTGKYKEAKEIFFTLDFLNPNDLRYTHGIAACYHMLKDYAKALAAYLRCMVSEPMNPITYWHIADCYKHLDDKVSALVMLQMCARISQEDKEFEPLRLRADSECACLERELDAELEKNKNKVT